MKQAEVHLAFNGERWFIRMVYVRDGAQRPYRMGPEIQSDGFDRAVEAADHAERILKVGIYDSGPSADKDEEIA